MFKLIEKFLSGLLRGWNSLSKRTSSRVQDQVFLLLTFVLLQGISFITWALVLYMLLYAVLALK
jgi:hypothetical protein